LIESLDIMTEVSMVLLYSCRQIFG